jgi:hypothetical protein
VVKVIASSSSASRSQSGITQPAVMATVFADPDLRKNADYVPVGLEYLALNTQVNPSTKSTVGGRSHSRSTKTRI